MINRLTVVFDACVLYPAPLRDLLMCLSFYGHAFAPKWSTQIQNEWKRNLLKKRPDLDRIKLDMTTDYMNKAIPTAQVRVPKKIINRLILPDPNDRHVLAVAIQAKASLIITFNLKDFPHHILKRYNVQAIDPDAFISQLLTNQPEAVLFSVDKHLGSLNNPSKTITEYLYTLHQQGLVTTANALANYW